MSQAMTLRVAAAQATLDLYLDKPFVWGKWDCARLAAHCLKGLGHRPNLSRFGFYKSALGAARAMKREGFADLAAYLDDGLRLMRIPQAAALPADILGFRHPDQELPVGLGVAVGNGRILAFLEDRICHVVSPDLRVAEAEYYAWRASPCRS